jgi:hypothetical protein
MKAGHFARNPFLPFHFEKSYLDLIDQDGNCFIIYRAKLRISVLKLTYSGLVFSDKRGNTTEASSILRRHFLKEGRTISLSSRGFRLSGRWGPPLSNKRSFVFYYPGSGRLEWQCHHPGSAAMICLEGKKYRGYGYGETITMNFKPSQLPITELRWGRFISSHSVLIWIEWKGRQALNLVFYNEKEYHDAVIDDRGLKFGNEEYDLRFIDPLPIRTGKLVDVLKDIPLLRFFFRKAVLDTVEHKYKSMAILKRKNAVPDSGWSLFETVIWKN